MVWPTVADTSCFQVCTQTQLLTYQYHCVDTELGTVTLISTSICTVHAVAASLMAKQLELVIKVPLCQTYISDATLNVINTSIS